MEPPTGGVPLPPARQKTVWYQLVILGYLIPTWMSGMRKTGSKVKQCQNLTLGNSSGKTVLLLSSTAVL
jgi:hypothetical protein